MAKRAKLKKSATAYRTISEVAEELEVPQHVLRFWESKFKEIEPLKRAGGRRYYRPEDVDLLKKIHFLLYTKGYTIKGVQKLFATNDDMTQELVGISEYFNLITEPQPIEIVERQQAKLAQKKVAQSQTAAPQQNNVPVEDMRNLLQAALSDLKSIRETLNTAS